MSKNRQIAYKKNSIPEYQQKILLGNECKSFVPISTLNKEDTTTIIYHLEGLKRLDSMQNIGTLELLTAIIDLIKLTELAADRLLFIDDYLIKLEYLYIHKATDRLVLMYIPREGKEVSEGNIETIIGEMMCLANDSGSKYVNLITQYIAKEQPDGKQLIKYIDRFCQEVYQCAIE